MLTSPEVEIRFRERKSGAARVPRGGALARKLAAYCARQCRVAHLRAFSTSSKGDEAPGGWPVCHGQLPPIDRPIHAAVHRWHTAQLCLPVLGLFFLADGFEFRASYLRRFLWPTRTQELHIIAHARTVHWDVPCRDCVLGVQGDMAAAARPFARPPARPPARLSVDLLVCLPACLPASRVYCRCQ